MFFALEKFSEEIEFLYNARWLWIWLIVLWILVKRVYQNEKEISSRRWKTVLITLRVSVLMLLVVFLYEPQKTWEEIIEKKSTLLVLVDQSLSMSVTADEFVNPLSQEKMSRVFGKSFSNLSRWEQQRNLANKLQSQLQKSSELKFVGYGSDLKELAEPVSWDSTLDRHTRLANALNVSLGKLRGGALSGVILLGDGNIDYVEKVHEISERLKNQHQGVPLFSVGIGSPEVVPDMRVDQFNTPDVVVKSDDPITFKGIISSRGIDPGSVVISRLILNQNVVEEKEIKLSGKSRQEISFDVVLDQPGDFSYSFSIEQVDGEKVIENNSKTASVKVKDEKLKVLYIENFPRWDYLKITQFLERNPKIYESSFLLIQAGHKIEQRGTRPIRKLPETFDSLWESTDVVILGDVGIKYFSSSQFLNNLEKFVSRGGGLIYLSGIVNNPISYKDTFLENLCPIYLAPDHLERVRGAERKSPFKFKPTDLGLGHPITKMSSELGQSESFWSGAPRGQWFYRPHGIKPLTHILLEHPEKKCTLDNQPIPLVGVMSYGKGQVLYVGFDELHRWSFLDDSEYIVNRFISQMVTYMSSRKISGTAGRYLLETNAAQISLGDAIDVTLQFDDAAAISESFLNISWSVDGGELSQLKANRESTESKIFKARLKPDRKGSYEFYLDDLGQKKKVYVTDFSREFENAELKKNHLKKFSGENNYYDFDQIDQLVENVLSRQIVQRRKMSQSFLLEPFVWWILVLLMTLLAAEWWIRKRQHLL